MPQVKALFFLPTVDNDGRDLTAEIEQVRDELILDFDGYTFMGYVKGAFRMADGSVSRDVNEAYFVVLNESRVGELEGVLRRFKQQTLQEALYLEVQRDVDVRLIR